MVLDAITERLRSLRSGSTSGAEHGGAANVRTAPPPRVFVVMRETWRQSGALLGVRPIAVYQDETKARVFAANEKRRVEEEHKGLGAVCSIQIEGLDVVREGGVS